MVNYKLFLILFMLSSSYSQGLGSFFRNIFENKKEKRDKTHENPYIDYERLLAVIKEKEAESQDLMDRIETHKGNVNELGNQKQENLDLIAKMKAETVPLLNTIGDIPEFTQFVDSLIPETTDGAFPSPAKEVRQGEEFPYPEFEPTVYAGYLKIMKMFFPGKAVDNSEILAFQAYETYFRATKKLEKARQMYSAYYANRAIIKHFSQKPETKEIKKLIKDAFDRKSTQKKLYLETKQNLGAELAKVIEALVEAKLHSLSNIAGVFAKGARNNAAGALENAEQFAKLFEGIVSNIVAIRNAQLDICLVEMKVKVEQFLLMYLEHDNTRINEEIAKAKNVDYLYGNRDD